MIFKSASPDKRLSSSSNYGRTSTTASEAGGGLRFTANVTVLPITTTDRIMASREADCETVVPSGPGNKRYELCSAQLADQLQQKSARFLLEPEEFLIVEAKRVNFSRMRPDLPVVLHGRLRIAIEYNRGATVNFRKQVLCPASRRDSGWGHWDDTGHFLLPKEELRFLKTGC